MQDYLTQIPAGREGYIYLIHAEGTNRHKIGRSVNPIARAADIQKQSPYQLKIIRSAWTLDAPSDEAKLHKRYADWRIFGEWFELDQLLEGSTGKPSETRLYAVECEFKYLSPTMRSVAKYSIKELGNFLNCALHSFNNLGSQLVSDINRLYEQASNRLDVAAAQEFLTCILPGIVLEKYQSNHDELLVVLAGDRAKEYGFEGRLISFMAGAIATFKVVGLKKGGLS